MSQTIHSFIHSIIFFLSPVIPMIIYVSSASRDVTLDLGLVLEALRKKTEGRENRGRREKEREREKKERKAEAEVALRGERSKQVD